VESPQNALRYRLVGPKVQVTKVEKGTQGMKIHMRMGTVTMIWDAPIPKADVRVGDLLTLYTEVLVNAEPSQTSVQ
jgi:hypothetical protein